MGKEIKTTVQKKINKLACFVQKTPKWYFFIGGVVIIVSGGILFLYFPKFLAKGKLNFESELKLPILMEPLKINQIFPRLNQKEGIFSQKVSKTIEPETLSRNFKLLERAAYAVEQSELEKVITDKFLLEFAENVTLFPETLITIDPINSIVPNIETAIQFKTELKIRNVRNAIYDKIMRKKKYISLDDVKNVLNTSIPENVREVLVEVTKKGIEKKIKN
jgi:hypothetical protein